MESIPFSGQACNICKYERFLGKQQTQASQSFK